MPAMNSYQLLSTLLKQCLVLVVMCLTATAFAQQDTADPVTELNTSADYQLGVGDVVRISVLGEPDLSMSTQVPQQGAIAYPYLGELMVLGRTVTEVKNEITQRLSGDYLVDPNVTVSVESYRTIFIGGEVARTGSLPYQPGLTVEKAIFLAGGFTERSAKNRVTVASEDGKERRVGLDYSLQPGDIITVPRRFF